MQRCNARLVSVSASFFGRSRKVAEAVRFFCLSWILVCKHCEFHRKTEVEKNWCHLRKSVVRRIFGQKPLARISPRRYAVGQTSTALMGIQRHRPARVSTAWHEKAAPKRASADRLTHPICTQLSCFAGHSSHPCCAQDGLHLHVQFCIHAYFYQHNFK